MSPPTTSLTRRSTAALLALQPPSAGAVDPVRAAQDVFAADDFWWKRLQTGSAPEVPWLQAIFESVFGAIGRGIVAVLRFLGGVLRALFGGMGVEASGGTSLVWVLAVALLLLAAWKLAPLLWNRRRAVPAAAAAEGPAPEALPAASELRNEAEQALRDGRHAEAVRLALLSLIAALETRGLLRYDSARTNREYRAELRPRPELAEGFGRLARIYEAIWYGREPAGREQAEESIRLFQSTLDREAPGPG